MSDMFISFFGAGLWAVIRAVLILILAFIAAAIVRSLVMKLVKKTKLTALSDKSSSGGDEGKKTGEHIGKLAYLLVFLLFVPGIFESLGMNEVSMPIVNLLDTMWGYLPNILAAVIVLWVGLFVAKLVRDILIPVFEKIKVNRLQEMAGIDAADRARLSSTLAYIVYVLILIPVIITALQVLDIKAVSDPAIRMLDIIFGFIPNIFVALVIIIVGCMVAKLGGNIVESLIASAGLDAKLGSLLDNKDQKFVLSKIVGIAVHTIIVIFFIVESFGVLHLQVLTDIGSAIIAYMPRILAAVLILGVCFVSDKLIRKALYKNGHTMYGLLSRCAVYTIGVFMVLNELGVAAEIVNMAFVIILAALAVAFAVAFGIGGKDTAAKLLKKLEDKTEENAE